MKKNVDALLKQALTPTQAPGVQLNQEIIRQAKEREDMGKKEQESYQQRRQQRLSYWRRGL